MGHPPQGKAFQGLVYPLVETLGAHGQRRVRSPPTHGSQASSHWNPTITAMKKGCKEWQGGRKRGQTGTVMGRERGSEPRAPEWRRDGQHGWPVQSRPALSRQRLRGRADAVASAAAGPWGCVGPGLGVPRLPFRAGQARTPLRSTHCLPLGSEGRACRPTDALTPGFGAWVDPALLASCKWSSELESPGQ